MHGNECRNSGWFNGQIHVNVYLTTSPQSTYVHFPKISHKRNCDTPRNKLKTRFQTQSKSSLQNCKTISSIGSNLFPIYQWNINGSGCFGIVHGSVISHWYFFFARRHFKFQFVRSIFFFPSSRSFWYSVSYFIVYSNQKAIGLRECNERIEQRTKNLINSDDSFLKISFKWGTPWKLCWIAFFRNGLKVSFFFHVNVFTLSFSLTFKWLYTIYMFKLLETL